MEYTNTCNQGLGTKEFRLFIVPFLLTRLSRRSEFLRVLYCTLQSNQSIDWNTFVRVPTGLLQL